MKRRIATILYPIFLALISLFLAFQNYTPGTYLSGWDTLHPEFNFGLNLERVLSGVFRPEQGLGAVAAHSHMAEIPRILELFVLNFIFPTDTLRYISILSSLIIGPLGMYFLLSKLLKNKLLVFVGGLFYLLNLGTLQQFIVPFEMFTTQYAMLPWLFLYITEYLISGNKKTLLFFSIITFLATPMAYAATLWYGYFMSLILFLFIFAIANKTKQSIRRSLMLILMTLLVNSFWLLPNIYFVLNHATEVTNSKINTLFTEEAFAQNVSFGNLADLALFKGFLFNWGISTGSTFNQLLEAWIKHLGSPFVLTLGYSFFTIILIGIISNIKKRGKFFLPILSMFILSFFFLLNINPPLGFIFQFVQEQIPFFKEAIRFPFTKFSIIFIFSSSIFFAYGISFLTHTMETRLKYARVFVLFFVIASLFYYMLPAFSGNLVSPYMRISIPKEYFELSEWFNKQPQGRIAYLPVHSFWGWEYYKWYDEKPSFQGAGFIWFGIKQPMLNRDFDRWNSLNEQYYREISYAIYKQDIVLFNSVLSKYDISYILLDKSVTAPGADPKVLFFDQIQSLINQQGLIKKEAQFGKNIFVYKLPSKNNVYTLNDYKIIAPKSTASYEDLAYRKYGNYITSKAQSTEVSMPFRDLIDNQNKFLNDRVNITQDGVSVTVPQELKNLSLELPKFEDLEKSAASDVVVEKTPGNTLKITFFPKFPKSPVPLVASTQLPPGEKNFLLSINQKSFILNNLAENTPLSLGTVFLNTDSQNSVTLYQDKDDIQIIPNFSTLSSSVDSCSLAKGELGINNQGNSFSLSAKNTDLCMMTPLSKLVEGYETLPGNEVLLGIKYNLSQTSNSSLCMASLTNGSCIDYGLKSGNFVFFEIKKEDVKNLGMKIFIEAGESKQGEKSSYTDILITLKKPLFTVNFSKDVLKLSFDYLKTIKDQSIDIAFPGSEQYSRDITTLSKTSGDCQNNQGPLAPKKQIVKQELENYIRYIAEEGSFCDHFSYQNLPQDQAYIIAVQSRNIKGLPIRLCVANHNSKRCDLYTHLSNSPEFKQDVFLIPPMSNENNPGSGFDININNLGIKNVPSINDLSSIYIIPFPYYWLSQIEIKKPQKQQKEQIMVLSQSYENGWKAYEVKNNNFLTNTFPFILGREVKDHVLVNNWANGWILPEASKSSRVIMVFLPQYLEYLGFLILLLVPVFVYRLKK